MASAPLWGKHQRDGLVVIRPALDKVSCMIVMSWCSARFASTGGSEASSSTKYTPPIGETKPAHGETTGTRWLDRFSIKNDVEHIALTYRVFDGTRGVCFNDSTQALATPGHDFWTFVDCHAVTKHLWSATTGLSPALRYRARQLEQLLPQKQAVNRSAPSANPGHISYLQQWAQTPDASVFVFSHGTIQISFSDRWDIVVKSTGALQASYLSKPATLPGDTERRMEYLQEALSRMSSEVIKHSMRTPVRRIHTTRSLRSTRMMPLVVTSKTSATPPGTLRSLLPKQLFGDNVAPTRKTTVKHWTTERAVVTHKFPCTSLMGDLPSMISESSETEDFFEANIQNLDIQHGVEAVHKVPEGSAYYCHVDPLVEARSLIPVQIGSTISLPSEKCEVSFLDDVVKNPRNPHCEARERRGSASSIGDQLRPHHFSNCSLSGPNTGADKESTSGDLDGLLEEITADVPIQCSLNSRVAVCKDTYDPATEALTTGEGGGLAIQNVDCTANGSRSPLQPVYSDDESTGAYSRTRQENKVSSESCNQDSPGTTTFGRYAAERSDSQWSIHGSPTTIVSLNNHRARDISHQRVNIWERSWNE